MWSGQLQAHNSKFVLTADFNQQKSEVFNLVLTDPNVVEFELMMAKAARLTNANTATHPYYGAYYLPSAYLPTPTLYCEASSSDVDQFFERTSDVTSFVKELSDVAEVLSSAHRAKYHFSAMQRLVKEGSHKMFMTLLHFTLFTSANLVEVSTPWYKSLSTPKVKVFTVKYPKYSRTWANIGNYSHFLFHGTWEYNAYSILRNGIKPSLTYGQVFMSNDINYSMGYARSFNKVFFCFEARTNQVHSLQHCSFPPSNIRIRAVIWIAGDYVGIANTVADNLIKDLNRGYRASIA